MPQASIVAWLQPLDALKHCPNSSNEAVAQRHAASVLKTMSFVPSVKQDQARILCDSRKSLHNFKVAQCESKHITHLRRLNSILLPIPYQDRFYNEIVQDPMTASLTRVALWHDPESTALMAPIATEGLIGNSRPVGSHVVGGIRCRLVDCVAPKSVDQSCTLYVATLGTLAPFRRHGIAHQLLSSVTQIGITDYGVRLIAAHVWEANEDALKWYQKHGFVIVDRIDNYYRRLAPLSAAYLVHRIVQPSDVLSGTVP